MAIQTMTLDPAAQVYTDDQIVAKINTASAQITRAGSVSADARPITSGEVGVTALAAGAAKSNLDAMSDTERGYIKTSPTAGQFKIVAVQRDADGKLQASYDDVAA